MLGCSWVALSVYLLNIKQTCHFCSFSLVFYKIHLTSSDRMYVHISRDINVQRPHMNRTSVTYEHGNTFTVVYLTFHHANMVFLTVTHFSAEDKH